MPPGRGLGSGASKKRDPDAVKVLSQFGKTAQQHLQELKEKILEKSGPDLVKDGWTCKLETGSDDGVDTTTLIPVYISADGKAFHSRKAVEKALGLRKSEKSEPQEGEKNAKAEKAERIEKRPAPAPAMSREEAYQKARQAAKKSAESQPVPFKIPHLSGTLTVNNLGKINHDRETFHSSRHLWPIGFRSSWKEKDEVLYESEVLDGATVGKLDIGEIDGPVFMVTIKRAGVNAEEVFGKSPRDAWRKALKVDDVEDRFGFGIEEIKRRIEGLKHSKDCVDYVFLDMRQPKADEQRRSKDKDRGKSSDKGSKKKFKGPPPRKLTAKQARERDRKDSKELEAKRIKEDAAAKKKQAAEEAARKKREQQEEERWLSRYPIEDLALEVEAKAMRAEEGRGRDVHAQRIAARAAAEAVERGHSQAAALVAAEAAVATHLTGAEAQESLEAGLAAAEEWEADGMQTDEAGAPEEDSSCQSLPAEFRVGARVRMVFSERLDGAEQEVLVPYEGVILQQPTEARDKYVLSFRSETGLQVEEIRLPDPDVQLLPGDTLRLPPKSPPVARASYYAADLLGLLAFMDSFRSELELPKGGVRELVEALGAPWSSPFLGDLYQALLAACFQMAEQQALTVPPQWCSDTTLTGATWPEVLRRWLLFGPRKDLHRRTAVEAFCYHCSLLDRGVGGSGVSPEGHLAMLVCLMEDVLEHEDVKRIVDKRVETGDELRRDWAQVPPPPPSLPAARPAQPG
jgi:hypothetical protein